MPQLDELIAELQSAPRAAVLLADFVPPLRFRDKRFDGYAPDPAHPSQASALAGMRALATRLQAGAGGWRSVLGGALGRRGSGRGTYLDGGFGVGKTHLLAALWNAAPGPRSYLSFDELVYTIGLLGVERARELFRGQRLVAVDEWELDDPGNLKLALAFLRGALADGAHVAVTSNTLPDELGRGRFSQKDFAREIAELAQAFDVVRISGEDYRHRRFEAVPGREYFVEPETLRRLAAADGGGALVVGWETLRGALERVHPIRYTGLVDAARAVYVEGLEPVAQLPDALRWVHLVDKLYDSATPLAASARMPLGELFPTSFLEGPFSKKFSRCLSRMEELLGESGTEARRLAG
jgi:cell division protein ZapE